MFSLLKKKSLLFLTAFGSSCTVQQTSIMPSPPPRQEVTYLHRTDAVKSAIIVGRVSVLDNNVRKSSVAAAAIAVNDKITLANDNGEYSLVLPAGIHTLVVGQIGFYKSEVTLKISQGDSIKANFNLQYDQRPTSN